MRHVLLFLGCLDKAMAIILDKSNPNSNLDILEFFFQEHCILMEKSVSDAPFSFVIDTLASVVSCMWYCWILQILMWNDWEVKLEDWKNTIATYQIQQFIDCHYMLVALASSKTEIMFRSSLRNVMKWKE